MKHSCGWIFSKPGEFPVRRCGAPVGYRLVKDDDGRPVRQYHPWCPEHTEAAERQADDDE
jgi:hypothetical protein